MGKHLTIFTNHAAVLLYLLEHPDATIRRIADDLGFAKRTVTGVLRDLRTAGYLLAQKKGRHNVYWVNPQAPLRRPEHQGQSLEEFLARLIRELEQAHVLTRNSPCREPAGVAATEPVRPSVSGERDSLPRSRGVTRRPPNARRRSGFTGRAFASCAADTWSAPGSA